MENMTKNTKNVKKAKKESQFEIILDPKFEEDLKKYNIKKLFKLNSFMKNKDILIGLIHIHKIIDYKCHSDKCSVINTWLGNPLELLLIHKNNKETDNRICNLTFNCYNCYFQNNSDKTLFKKVKKEKVIGCKICGFNLSRLSATCKKLGICKICISKNNKNHINDGLALFSNTFSNSLTNADLIEQQKQESTITIDESMKHVSILSKSKGGITNQEMKAINSSVKNKRNTKNSNKNSNKHNSNNSQDNNLSINIEIGDITMGDLDEIKSIMNK
jgi:hypothetical protein